MLDPSSNLRMTAKASSYSIWYGSTQWQIKAFRRFQIPDQLIEKHGYPKLTRQVKEKIFGLNGAKVYGVDVKARLNEFSKDSAPSHRYYGWAAQ